MAKKKDDITTKLKAAYPELGISKVEVDQDSGKSTFFMKPTKTLPFIDRAGGAITPKVNASTITRRSIDRTALDLGTSTTPYDEEAQTSFRRAMEYYVNDPLVGSTINLLASLAYKGFENDIDDPAIKEFYDVWVYDTNFLEVLEWIFLDFFKIGHVTTYKAVAPYTARESVVSPVPGVAIKQSSPKKSSKTKKTQQSIVNQITAEVIANAEKLGINGHALTKVKELAAKKSKYITQIPVGYTVLNPLLVNITGSLFFDSTSVELTATDDLKELLKKKGGELTPEEKDVIDKLPKEFKKAMMDDGKLILDNQLVGQITYRKQPYERYAKPRIARIFDDLEFKKALKQADLSTVDGISNYILKITVGNDEYPVTSQTELENVAKLFDTPSKSFDVVWNHTLEIEKIVSPEIDKILGEGKYKQTNDDISAGLAISRALLDGTGNVNTNQLNVLIKGLVEEVNYARRQVTRWIYKEYTRVAEVVGFDRIPKVRWDDSTLKDTILYMSIISQLVDRRMLSYKTALEDLGFDYSTELTNMTEELPLVQDGTFGIIGSPFQQSSTQDVQNSPTGTPSSGRPKAQPAKPKEKDSDPATKTKAEKLTTEGLVKTMTDDEFNLFVELLAKARKSLGTDDE